MAKEMTLDELARITAKGFEEAAKKADMDFQFHRVNERFTGVENRLDALENRMAGVENRLAALENKFHQLMTLLQKKEEELSAISAQLKQLADRVAKLEARK